MQGVEVVQHEWTVLNVFLRRSLTSFWLPECSLQRVDIQYNDIQTAMVYNYKVYNTPTLMFQSQ